MAEMAYVSGVCASVTAQHMGEIVPVGDLPPDRIHTPGFLVSHLIPGYFRNWDTAVSHLTAGRS